MATNYHGFKICILVRIKIEIIIDSVEPEYWKANDTSTFERCFLTSQILNNSKIFSVTERRTTS